MRPLLSLSRTAELEPGSRGAAEAKERRVRVRRRRVLRERFIVKFGGLL